MIFEILETSDEEGAATGVMLIFSGKVVGMFPSAELAVAYAEYQFAVSIEEALRSPRKIAKLVFERHGNRVVELDDGTDSYCIVIDPLGNVAPRNFTEDEAIQFIEAKLAINFGRKK